MLQPRLLWSIFLGSETALSTFDFFLEGLRTNFHRMGRVLAASARIQGIIQIFQNYQANQKAEISNQQAEWTNVILLWFSLIISVCVIAATGCVIAATMKVNVT